MYLLMILFAYIVGTLTPQLLSLEWAYTFKFCLSLMLISSCLSVIGQLSCMFVVLMDSAIQKNVDRVLADRLDDRVLAGRLDNQKNVCGFLSLVPNSSIFISLILF